MNLPYVGYWAGNSAHHFGTNNTILYYIIFDYTVDVMFVLAADRTCPPDTFTCASNKQVKRYPCISRDLVCDGDRNCHLGEDEQQSCPPRSCKPGDHITPSTTSL